MQLDPTEDNVGLTGAGGPWCGQPPVNVVKCERNPGAIPAAMRLHKGKTGRMSTAAREQPMSSITYGRLRRLLCSHHQTIHGSAATRCASCGQRV